MCSSRQLGSRLHPFLWSLVFFLLLPLPIAAQQYTRDEITVGVHLQTIGLADCQPIGSSGLCKPATDHGAFSAPSFTYTRNLSPSLALEGTVMPPSFFREADGTESGRETMALGGVKTGWRGHRWGFYGEAQAGIASFSCGTWQWSQNAYSNCARQTHFALEYGGVAEYRLTPRTSIRLDVKDMQLAEFDNIVARYADGSPFIYQAGAIAQHLDARIGITRSLGHLIDATPEPGPERQSWDLGVTFALQPRIQPEFEYLNPYPEWGLWASWNFSRHVSWDTTLLHASRNPGQGETIDYQAGGRAFEALSGVKIGIRRDHMGYFAKVRPGTITFGETVRQLIIEPNNTVKLDDGMFTNFVLDTGGVYEVYPSRHTILRAEAGSATIFYLPKTVVYGSQRYDIPELTRPSLLMIFGAGVRF